MGSGRAEPGLILRDTRGSPLQGSREEPREGTFWASGAAENLYAISDTQASSRVFGSPARRSTQVDVAPSAPWPCTSPVSGRRLVAGEGAPGLLVVPQESVCPGTPAVVVSLARSSPEVGSHVQGG